MMIIKIIIIIIIITYVDHKGAVTGFEFVVIRADVSAVNRNCSVNVARLHVYSRRRS